eukprot:TRINITY_DN13097_c0_g1_i1.p1 TRINITY_DN13097_c0_g1~~TRINITY_DN13097_c0_g1_i1.p1  ORF type:complete len:114 (+),score=3.64 TRINITY_DN13097_c0_g1_i1:43-384(+)
MHTLLAKNYRCKPKLFGFICLCAVICYAESIQLFISPNGTDSQSCGDSTVLACKSLQQAIYNGATTIMFVPGYYHWSEFVNITAPTLSLLGMMPDQVAIDCQSNVGWTLNVAA